MSLIDLPIPIFLSFREGLEATLVVIIILLYLKNTKQKDYNKYVFIGTLAAIISSIVFAIIFTTIFGGFTGRIEQIFEGFTFLISGFLIITLILWMSREAPNMKKNLETKVEESIQTQKTISIVFLTYIIIIREGIELVLLLTGVSSISSLNALTVILGSIIGISFSIAIGIIIFYGVKSIDLSTFFKITNIILILFSAGLIVYGIHELIEAGLVNPLINEVWNIKGILPEDFPDSNPLTPWWLEVIGSLLKSLFGYNANPSLLEVILYPVIIITVSTISILIWKKNSRKNKIA
ncbi:MAG: FTR1 family protein [Candidatus Thorarchaeota archaeon]